MRRLALLLPILLASPALGQGAEPSATTATYGNWTVTCQQVAEARVCQMLTRLNVKGEDGQVRPLLEMAIGRPPAGGDLRLVLQVPMDVALREPVTLATNAEGATTADPAAPPLLTASYFACLPNGCLADAVLDQAGLKAMTAAATATVTFTVLNGNRKVAVPVALSGFADAWAALGEAAP